MHQNLWPVALLWLTGFFSLNASATELNLQSQWQLNPLSIEQVISQATLPSSADLLIDKVSLTGGRYWTSSEIMIREDDTYVIDFKNTSVIASFRHFIFDSQKQLLHDIVGGLSSKTSNPFFLRNGRVIHLKAGHYTVISQIQSEFYLAQPERYITTLSEYQQSIKPGNALVLTGLGIFIGLGIYYAALAVARRRLAEAMYAAFILGNLLFNSSAHLLLKDLFGITSIYMAGGPILFSNIAYIIFVMALLGIKKQTHFFLFNTGTGLIWLFSIFILLAPFFPNWTLEFARYGVGLFLSYGLWAGISGYRQGNTTAKIYLVAIISFFILGGLAITQSRLSATSTLTIEHIGLLAVAVEVILLALVLSYQFALLQRENESIQRKLIYKTQLAATDSLTDLNNRMKLDQDLKTINDDFTLTFIDLDNLKRYNDQYGHARGDELLKAFSSQLKSRFENSSDVYRIGGDEFAVLSPHNDIDKISSVISSVIEFVRENGFSSTGASYGMALKSEAKDISTLKHLADMRMYNNKQQRKSESLPPELVTQRTN